MRLTWQNKKSVGFLHGCNDDYYDQKQSLELLPWLLPASLLTYVFFRYRHCCFIVHSAARRNLSM